jgi:hypothetical protein
VSQEDEGGPEMSTGDALRGRKGLVHERLKASPQIVVALRFALPHDQGVPASLTEGIEFLAVAADVVGKLLAPEVGVVLRDGQGPTYAVLVPEAAVDEDNLTVSRQHDVGPAGRLCPVEADGWFRTLVLVPDPNHNSEGDVGPIPNEARRQANSVPLIKVMGDLPISVASDTAALEK